MLDSPEHVFLSGFSVYPGLQEHENEPWVFVQTWEHPPLLELHSSSSVSIKEKKLIV